MAKLYLFGVFKTRLYLFGVFKAQPSPSPHQTGPARVTTSSRPSSSDYIVQAELLHFSLFQAKLYPYYIVQAELVHFGHFQARLYPYDRRPGQACALRPLPGQALPLRHRPG